MFNTIGIIILAVVLLGLIAYFTEGTYRGALSKTRRPDAFGHTDSTGANNPRDIIATMNETGRNCVVFYGSQTGTAEEFASRLVQEGRSRFGLKTMITDLGDYDYDNLDAFLSDKVAIFVLAT